MKHVTDPNHSTGYRQERSSGQREDQTIGIDSEGLRRGEIKFPPPKNDRDPNDPAWRTEFYEEYPWRQDPISCYWWIWVCADFLLYPLFFYYNFIGFHAKKFEFKFTIKIQYCMLIFVFY